MAEATAGGKVFEEFILAQGRALRAKDAAPATRKAWEERRAKLRAAMFAAMGPFPDKPCALEPREMGVLKRTGYRIEKLVFQTRPDVWVTASLYVPEPTRGKRPAVLCVHGHWTEGRRSPVVQARCLGLVKLGFVVLAVDAFGAGERHPTTPTGAYHGALIGSTLWPAGQTLLGVQVYDNRRAVDYLRSRPEVDGDRLGITGASGGGNQTMYAGALDERFRAVVPVCSVGNYQAYLKAACCVCEVLPGALRFTEEGDVLGLVAPRALMVVSATRDAYQFSVGEAKKSLKRAEAIFKLHDAADRVKHAVFEAPHDYNREMREAMYGWMARWVAGEGTGKPIPEPKHTVEAPQDLRCYPDGKRPAAFLFPATLAAREGRRVLDSWRTKKLDHKEAWTAAAVVLRDQLRRDVFGGFPQLPRAAGTFTPARVEGGIRTTTLRLEPEPGLPMSVQVRFQPVKGRVPACVLLHLGGKVEALKHPLADALVSRGWAVYAPDLRATGETKPAHDAVVGAPDHNSAEHALWIGRPLLGQWVFDVSCLLDIMARQPGLDARRFAVAGLGPAGIVALCAAGLFEDRVASAAVLDAPVTFLTTRAYAAGTPMGLLAPGILRAGDVPHLAALCVPRRLVLAGGATPQGGKLLDKPLREAYAFTRRIYGLDRTTSDRLTVRETMKAEDVVRLL